MPPPGGREKQSLLVMRRLFVLFHWKNEVNMVHGQRLNCMVHRSSKLSERPLISVFRDPMPRTPGRRKCWICRDDKAPSLLPSESYRTGFIEEYWTSNLLPISFELLKRSPKLRRCRLVARFMMLLAILRPNVRTEFKNLVLFVFGKLRDKMAQTHGLGPMDCVKPSVMLVEIVREYPSVQNERNRRRIVRQPLRLPGIIEALIYLVPSNGLRTDELHFIALRIQVLPKAFSEPLLLEWRAPPHGSDCSEHSTSH